MIQFILTAQKRPEDFAELIHAFKEKGIQVVSTEATEEVLSQAEIGTLDLLVLDEALPEEPGREFIGKVISKNPMLNCVIASDRSKSDFHETYEGMGVLMQIPPIPRAENAKGILDRLEKILPAAGVSTNGIS